MSAHRAKPSRQAGAVLIVALLMLMVLTTLGSSTISSTSSKLQLLKTQQRYQETEQVAENTINYLLSDLDYFVNHSAYLDSNGGFAPSLPSYISNGMNITYNSLHCLREKKSSGCSISEGSSAVCYPDYYWEANITVTHSTSGASSTLVKGFKFRYLAGYCPA
ncbi:MAG: hypothetical protein P8H31_04300 [Porticoccaceae bacterium]|nr:hypothetical protein [Porticoccaceae bacterium]